MLHIKMDCSEDKCFYFGNNHCGIQIILLFLLMNAVPCSSEQTTVYGNVNDSAVSCSCNIIVCNTSSVLLYPLSPNYDYPWVIKEVIPTTNNAQTCKLNPVLVIGNMSLSIVQWNVPVNSTNNILNVTANQVSIVMQCNKSGEMDFSTKSYSSSITTSVMTSTSTSAMTSTTSSLSSNLPSTVTSTNSSWNSNQTSTMTSNLSSNATSVMTLTTLDLNSSTSYSNLVSTMDTDIFSTNIMTTNSHSQSMLLDCLLYKENGDLKFEIMIPVLIGIFLLFFEFSIIITCYCRNRGKQTAVKKKIFDSDNHKYHEFDTQNNDDCEGFQEISLNSIEPEDDDDLQCNILYTAHNALPLQETNVSKDVEPTVVKTKTSDSDTHKYHEFNVEYNGDSESFQGISLNSMEHEDNDGMHCNILYTAHNALPLHGNNSLSIDKASPLNECSDNIYTLPVKQRDDTNCLSLNIESDDCTSPQETFNITQDKDSVCDIFTDLVKKRQYTISQKSNDSRLSSSTNAFQAKFVNNDASSISSNQTDISNEVYLNISFAK